jgi:Zn-dependent protease with chaperone function
VAILAHELGHWKYGEYFHVLLQGLKCRRSRFQRLLDLASSDDFVLLRGWQGILVAFVLRLAVSHLRIWPQGLHSADMFASFGFHQQRPILIGLALFSLMTAPVSNFVGFLMNMVTRKFEVPLHLPSCLLTCHAQYEADKFATELGHDLAPALISIEAKNLSALDPDPV